MAYAFYYSDNSIIYLQTGLKSEKDAKKGLENIAEIFCNKKGKLANGRIDMVKDRKVRVLEAYKIRYENGSVRIEIIDITSIPLQTEHPEFS